MTKKEILIILDEHADKNYGDIYLNQHQEIAKDLLKYFKKQLLIQRVSYRRELLSDYNDWLNFEYAQFGLDDQDLDGFEKSLNCG
jgi:hypothetical protein